MTENVFIGLRNRILQVVARLAPGSNEFRVRLHRLRGVQIGEGVWIGYDAILETSYPYLITIGNRAAIGVRATIIAHYREVRGVTVEEDASVGPGSLLLPGVTIGKGSVVTAGSVVTQSVPPLTVVQGNPAKPIARLTSPVPLDASVKKFVSMLRPLL
jgi:acetyltransferase-like isoleucine patch superfamily enzyme